jgi:hypothetical protein
MLPPRALPPAHFERNEGTSYFVTWALPQHRLIAKKLRENPEAVLGLARRNLRRYIGRRRPSFGRLLLLPEPLHKKRSTEPFSVKKSELECVVSRLILLSASRSSSRSDGALEYRSVDMTSRPSMRPGKKAN